LKSLLINSEYFPKIIIKSITGLKRGFDCNVELEFYNRTKYTLNIVISEIDPEITKTLDIQKVKYKRFLIQFKV